MLYREYRAAENMLESQIQSVLEFARNASGQEETIESATFADVESELSDSEQQVLSYYRDYQQSRQAANDADANVDVNAEQGIATVMAKCKPMIEARNLASAPQDVPAKRSSSLRARLGEGIFAIPKAWSLPAGAVAAVALTVVALSLFKATEPANRTLELTGVTSYKEATDMSLIDDLPSANIGAMSFSPSDEETAIAYAAGSLVGELTVSLAANDRERSLQSLQRIELLGRTSGQFASDDQTGSSFNDSVLKLREQLKASTEEELLKDKSLLESLESLMSLVRGDRNSEQLVSYQKLGSWTLIAQTLLSASKTERNDAWRRQMLDRLVADAQGIHAELLAQPDLEEARRNALQAFEQFSQSWSANGMQDDTLRKMSELTRNIDTTFRI